MKQINPLQLLHSDPKPVEELSLKEYGCPFVYQLAVNSPNGDYLILRNPTPDQEGSIYDFENNHYLFQYTFPMHLKSVTFDEIRKTMIEELAWNGFIDAPEIEFVKVGFTNKRNTFVDSKEPLTGYMTKEFFEQIKIYQLLFGGHHNDWNVQNQMCKIAKLGSYKPYEDKWGVQTETEKSEFFDIYSEDLKAWEDLRQLNDHFHNTVCEFVIRIKDQDLGYRCSVLLGAGEQLILAE